MKTWKQKKRKQLVSLRSTLSIANQERVLYQTCFQN